MTSLSISTPFKTPFKPRTLLPRSTPQLLRPINAHFTTSSQSLGFKQPYVSNSQAPPTRGPPMESADVMGLLLRERILFLGSDIDDVVADAIVTQLLLLDAKDPKKDIRLFINSSGGSHNASVAIYDVIQLIRADVSTIALGTAVSSAAIILAGGTKGKRFAMPNTRIMIHQPSGGIGGQVSVVEVQAREVMNNKDTVTRIISDITGRSYEQVTKDINEDNFMSPLEAVEYGILDGVIDKDRILPLVPVPLTVKARANFTSPDYLKPVIPDDEIY